MRGDFHFHSTFSDGKLTPEELVKMAKEKNLDAACLTDHDTIEGSLIFSKLAREEGIISFPALEFSTVSNGESIHVLGYFKSVEDLPQEFLDHLKLMRQRRIDRMKKMVENVNRLYGFNISFEKILSEHPSTIERPHLAHEITEKTGISNRDVFNRYIGDSCPAYIPSAKMSTKDGIDLIHKAGGIAILAHPYQYKKNNPMDLIALGVDGVEVFYFPTPVKKHKPYKKYCKKNNLLISGGSDFHYEKDFQHSSIGSGEYTSPHLDNLIKAIEAK